MYVCLYTHIRKCIGKKLLLCFVCCVCVLCERARDRQRQSDRNRESGVRERDRERERERVCKCGGGESGGVYWCSSMGGVAFLFACPVVSRHLLTCPLAFLCVPFPPFFAHLALYTGLLNFHRASLILLYLCPRATICVLIQLYSAYRTPQP